MPSSTKLPVTEQDFNRIALAIRTTSEIGKKLRSSGLSERAVVVLLQDLTGLTQRDIRLVLIALPQLEAIYTKRIAVS